MAPNSSIWRLRLPDKTLIYAMATGSDEIAVQSSAASALYGNGFSGILSSQSRRLRYADKTLIQVLTPDNSVEALIG